MSWRDKRYLPVVKNLSNCAAFKLVYTSVLKHICILASHLREQIYQETLPTEAYWWADMCNSKILTVEKLHYHPRYCIRKS